MDADKNKDEAQKLVRLWKEKAAYWTKVNLVLCGVCVILPLLLTFVLMKIHPFTVGLGIVASTAGIAMAVLVPGARAAGFVLGIQHVEDALRGYKEERVASGELEKVWRYEKATLEPWRPPAREPTMQ